jgi:hypothetical protein
MKHLARHLFTFCAGLSLLLCVAASVLWARSQFTADFFDRRAWDDARGTYTETSVFWATGRLAVSYARYVPVGNDDAWVRRATGRWSHRVESGATLGYWLHWMHLYREDSESWHVGVRLWPIVVVSAILPAILLTRVARQQSRHRQGLCAVCGYDLRASPGRKRQPSSFIPTVL